MPQDKMNNRQNDSSQMKNPGGQQGTNQSGKTSVSGGGSGSDPKSGQHSQSGNQK